jgi:hypothetical protein
MTLSIPLIALIAIVVYVAYRNMGLRAWHAIACMILGFLLAATAAAPQITSILTAIIRWLGGSR